VRHALRLRGIQGAVQYAEGAPTRRWHWFRHLQQLRAATVFQPALPQETQYGKHLSKRNGSFAPTSYGTRLKVAVRTVQAAATSTGYCDLSAIDSQGPDQ
jgi:hypothetical protein